MAPMLRSITGIQEAKHADTTSDNGALIAVLGASCLTAMAATAITPALPGMAHAFAGTPNAQFLVKIALTLPALIIALSATIVGTMADRVGAGRVLIASVLLFAIAGSAGLYTPTLITLLISRAVLGFAIAGMSTGALTLIGALYEGERRQRVIGLQGTAASFGGMACLLLGGLLAAYDWRLPFATYLLSILLIPVMLACLPRGVLVASVNTCKTLEPTRWGHVAFAYCAAFLGMILFYVIPVQLPFHLRAHGVTDPTLTGYALSLCTFAGGLAAAFYSRLRQRMSPPMMVAIAFAMIAVGQTFVLSGSYASALGGMVIAGCSTGILLPTVNGLVLTATPAPKHGRFAGGVAASLFLGQFLAPVSAGIAERLAGSVFLGTALGAAVVAVIIGVGYVFNRRTVWR